MRDEPWVINGYVRCTVHYTVIRIDDEYNGYIGLSIGEENKDVHSRCVNWEY